MIVWGVIGIIVGIILLADLAVAVGVMALLVAFALVVIGIEELMAASYHTDPTRARILGSALIVVGILAAVWPHITVTLLAVLVGIGLLIAGLTRFAVVALAGRFPGWGWTIAGGIAAIAAAIITFAWPSITVVVIAVVFGVRMLFHGMIELWLGWELRHSS
jgi:uncharacterized membrane protein HdeD (DUF308 family)